MTTYPLFSILIANYNNVRFLQQSIESVYKQTYTNWEIIIIDDFSTDSPTSIYQSLKKNEKIKIYYNDKNYGCGYTKAACISKANGTVCAFLDPDDTLREDALEKMVRLHQDYPDYSLIHSKFYVCDENLRIESIYPNGKNVPPNQPYFFNKGGEITHFCSFKKSFYNMTEGIDKTLLRAVDQDLYLKLYDTGKTLYLDEALYYYRIHKGGISTNQNARKAFYWHWIVIHNTIKRRNINFEDEFFNYFVPKFEYDSLYEKYNKLNSNIIVRIIRKLRLL